jgi:hypothetical protein
LFSGDSLAPPAEYRPMRPANTRLKFGLLGSALGVREGTRMQGFTGRGENATSALFRLLAARNRDGRADCHGVLTVGSALSC